MGISSAVKNKEMRNAGWLIGEQVFQMMLSLVIGVPSPLVWERYVEFREKQAGASAQRVQFRNKQFGWEKYALSMGFSNDRQYLADKEVDPYLKGFLSDLYLRPSCHECSAKGLERVSDITLGDAWGLANVLNNGDKDVSVVLIRSSKAQAFLTELVEHLHYVSIENIQLVIEGNAALMRSAAANGNRQRFMEQLPGVKRVDKLILQNCRDPFVLAMKRNLKRLLKR